MKAKAAAPRHPPAAAPPLPWIAWVALAAWALLLALAPPDANGFWGVSGLRSIGVPARLIVIALALAIGWGAARVRAVPGALLALAALAIPAVLSFVVYERTHFLGDPGCGPARCGSSPRDSPTGPCWNGPGSQLGCRECQPVSVQGSERGHLRAEIQS